MRPFPSLARGFRQTDHRPGIETIGNPRRQFNIIGIVFLQQGSFSLICMHANRHYLRCFPPEASSE